MTCSVCGKQGHNRRSCWWRDFVGRVSCAKANFANDTKYDDLTEQELQTRLDEFYLEIIEYCRTFQAWGASKGLMIEADEVNFGMNAFPVYNMRGVMIQAPNTSTLDIRKLDPRWFN